MRVSSPYAGIALCILTLCFVSPIQALTLEELHSTPDLTPKKFAAFFKAFDFKFRKEVQTPEVFLATESGDCDDYSTLAAEVLRARGYTPRLITVRMPGVTHVVCYIEETRSYLDYNNRSYFSRTVSSGPALPEIADHVARSYRSEWTSVSEFTFEDGLKRLVKTVVEPRKKAWTFASLFR